MSFMEKAAASSSVFLRSLFVSFGSLFYVCPSLNCHVGLCYMDTGSAECLGFLRNSSSHFPGLCHLVLTCSHDSLFLRYPAIDIVWRGPVFLALGFLRHLALRGSAWWSPGLGWCSHQSFGSALPDFDTCLDSLQYSSCGIGSGIKPQWGVCYCLVSAFPSLPNCLRFHRPVVSDDEELGVRQVPSPPSYTGTSVSALRPCNPLAWSLHSCLRFHRTVVPMDDVRCGCSSHPAVTLRVDGSRCMWPLRSSQGVPTTG